LFLVTIIVRDASDSNALFASNAPDIIFSLTECLTIHTSAFVGSYMK